MAVAVLSRSLKMDPNADVPMVTFLPQIKNTIMKGLPEKIRLKFHKNFQKNRIKNRFIYFW